MAARYRKVAARNKIVHGIWYVIGFPHPSSASPAEHPSKELETFVNPHPGRDYTIRIRMRSSPLCPKTGQPDFATLLLECAGDALHRTQIAEALHLVVPRRTLPRDVTNRMLDDLARLRRTTCD